MTSQRELRLSERLALTAPSERPGAAQAAPDPSEPTTGEPPSPFPWLLPPRPNGRAMAPWLLAVLTIVALNVLLVVRIDG
jgi:hypothetical protein